MRAIKSKDAWEILRNEFKGNNKIILTKLQNLRDDFDNICTKEGKNVKDLFSILLL